jgi:hypothetical protein
LHAAGSHLQVAAEAQAPRGTQKKGGNVIPTNKAKFVNSPYIRRTSQKLIARLIVLAPRKN